MNQQKKKRGRCFECFCSCDKKVTTFCCRFLCSEHLFCKHCHYSGITKLTDMSAISKVPIIGQLFLLQNWVVIIFALRRECACQKLNISYTDFCRFSLLQIMNKISRGRKNTFYFVVKWSRSFGGKNKYSRSKSLYPCNFLPCIIDKHVQ